MQTRRPILKYALHLRDEQLPLAEKLPDRQFIRRGAFPQDPTGQVDGGEGEVREQGGAEVDFPSARFHREDPADDQVADFGRVARAEGVDAEELVGAEEGAGDGGEDGWSGRGGIVGAVAAVVIWSAWASLLRMETRLFGKGRERGWARGNMGLASCTDGTYRIHCGSSVTVSPGVTMFLEENSGCFAGRWESICIESSGSESSDGEGSLL